MPTPAFEMHWIKRQLAETSVASPVPHSPRSKCLMKTGKSGTKKPSKNSDLNNLTFCWSVLGLWGFFSSSEQCICFSEHNYCLYSRVYCYLGIQDTCTAYQEQNNTSYLFSSLSYWYNLSWKSTCYASTSAFNRIQRYSLFCCFLLLSAVVRCIIYLQFSLHLSNLKSFLTH